MAILTTTAKLIPNLDSVELVGVAIMVIEDKLFYHLKNL